MAINMFSKIKIRRGLQIDLPDLDKGEFGFTTDTGEVFIGAPDLPSLANKGRGESEETFPYKNIQLLSSINLHAPVQKYTLKGNDGPEVQTSYDLNTPVIRMYQNKFDDIFNLSDFIPLNRLEDYPTYINQAITETVKYKKVLHVSAGNYEFSNTMILPPDITLKGEGINSTIFTTYNDEYMFETVDGLLKTELDIGLSDAALPSNIHISDMTLANLSGASEELPVVGNIVRLNRANNVKFTNVKFVGGEDLTHVAIVIDRLGNIIDVHDITFEGCEFENLDKVIGDLNGITNISSNIKFINCKFNNVNSVVDIEHADIRNIEFVNCMFTNINDHIFNLELVNNFKSINNIYDLENYSSLSDPIYIGSGVVDFSSFGDYACR